ncbi:MAG TPA: MaoC family dehydratase [Nocardioidaceae bacterium]
MTDTASNEPHPPDTATNPASAARRTRRVTTRDIDLFTEITGDRNPVHYDAELAARSRFGGIVVQGGVTSGLLNALVAEDLPGPGSVFLNVNWNFRAPVKPGDLLTAEARVTKEHPDKPVTWLDTTIINQHDEVVLDGSAVVWRDPVVAAATAARGTPEDISPMRPARVSPSHYLHAHHIPAPARPATTRRKS